MLRKRPSRGLCIYDRGHRLYLKHRRQSELKQQQQTNERAIFDRLLTVPRIPAPTHNRQEPAVL